MLTGPHHRAEAYMMQNWIRVCTVAYDKATLMAEMRAARIPTGNAREDFVRMRKEVTSRSGKTCPTPE
jgi:hypothetical protein